MRIFRIIAVALMMATTLTLSAKTEQKAIYMFGLSASFNDSTVYFTPIQQVDSAYINPKSGFLTGRAEYSNQLRYYMRGRGVANPTCVTFFSSDRKKIEKKYIKVKEKYTGKKAKKQYFVRQLENTDFSFEAVKPEEAPVIVVGK